MRIRRKHIVWGLVGVAVMAVIVLVLRPDSVQVETATVVRGPLRVTIAEEGRTRLRSRFVVSAPVAGRVLRVEALPGDAVRAGQTLAVIVPASPTPLDARTRVAAEARVRTAEATLERAKADEHRIRVEADQAETEAQRTERLFEGGSVAKEAVEVAETRRQSAAAAVVAAAAAVRAAEFTLAEARAALVSAADRDAGRQVSVPAPLDGVILRRVQESESVIAAGTPLLELGDLRDLEIVADLLSTDAVRVRPGAEVVISRWGGDEDLEGRVERVEPAGFTKVSALGVEEQRVNVVVTFVDPPDARARLGDGFRVEVAIVVWEQPSVLTVPTAALFRAGGQWVAFVVSDGRLARRDVEVGQQGGDRTEVLGGLSEGEVVVVYPGESLSPGARVETQ